MRVLVIGCGYVGLALGTELVRQGHEVAGIRRRENSEPELRALGIIPLITDITQPEDLARIPANYDWVVNCVSSSRGGVGEYEAVYVLGNRNLIEWLAAAPPKKFIYTSSTSVYGQTDGSMVDETSLTEPQAATAKILVAAENLLFQAAHVRKFPAIILRIAGIYGPHRGYWFKQFLKGEARIEGNGERVMNMIHRDDVVGSIIAALRNGVPGEAYNVIDNEPVTQMEFFKWLSETMHKPLPASVPEEHCVGRKRKLTNKQVSNSKLRNQLGYELKYPSFREGYSAEIQRMLTPGRPCEP